MYETQNPPPITSADSNDRVWAMLCHLGTLATWFPFANIIIPLVIWSVKKDSSPLVDDQGKEALNFQITIMIGYALCIPLCFILIGILPVIALGLYHVVFSVIAAIKSNEGFAYRYPLTLRLIH